MTFQVHVVSLMYCTAFCKTSLREKCNQFHNNFQRFKSPSGVGNKEKLEVIDRCCIRYQISVTNRIPILRVRVKMNCNNRRIWYQWKLTFEVARFLVVCSLCPPGI